MYKSNGVNNDFFWHKGRAWDYLKWGHIIQNQGEGGQIIASNLVVMAEGERRKKN